MSVDYFIDKPTWYGIKEEGARGIWLIDADWSDYYVLVSAVVELDIELLRL